MKLVNSQERRSIRLKDYDYAQLGAYFVTICTVGRRSMFREMHGTTDALSELGTIVEQSWEWLSRQYDYVILDTWVVMPNHTHSILVITEDPNRDLSAPKKKSLGSLIGAFKTFSTKQINSRLRSPGSQVWQRNYYEHVIRTEENLNRIRQFIADNPLQWDIDRENPLKSGNHPFDHLF